MQSKLTHRTVKTLQSRDKPYEVMDNELKGFMIRVQPSGAMTYYYRYRNTQGNCQRYRIGQVGTITVTQARDIAQQCAAKVMNGQDIHHLKKKHREISQLQQNNTLGNFIENHYKPWFISERKSATKTLSSLSHNFHDWYSCPITNLTLSQVEQWCLAKRKEGIKTTTLNRNIAALRAALSKAIDWEIIGEHPLKKWKPLKSDQQAKVRYLSEDEEIRLRDALYARDQQLKQQRNNANKWRTERAYPLLLDLDKYPFSDYLTPMVLLSLNTGMRRGELFHLNWQDINFNQSVVTIIGDNAKSGKTRHIALNEEAIFILKNWHEIISLSQPKASLVFPNSEGKPYGDVKKAWKRLLYMANITDFRWHDMRHHFASQLVMQGVDLNTVRELLGHADLKMTLRYAHLAPEHKAKAVALLVKQKHSKYIHSPEPAN